MTKTSPSISESLCILAACALFTGCTPSVTTNEPRQAAPRAPRRASHKTTCRVLLNLDRGKVADVRIESVLRVTLGHGTVLRQDKHTYEIWKRQHRRSRREHRYHIEAGSSWQNLMARKLPVGKPFVLQDTKPEWADDPSYGRGDRADKNDPKSKFSQRTKIWIQATFGGFLAYFSSTRHFASGMTRPSHSFGYKLKEIRGTAVVRTLLSNATLRSARRIWRAFLRHKDTEQWVKTDAMAKAPELWDRDKFWGAFNYTLRFPMAPDSRPSAHRGKQFVKTAVIPSQWHVPGLFLQNTLRVGSMAVNHMNLNFAIRMATVPPLLKDHAPKPGTTLVAAPDGCASVDLQTNEVVSPQGRRRKLPGVSNIIGVTWIPGEDPFNVRQLQGAAIEAAPSLRRARQYQQKKQYTKAAEHYLHGGRLLVTVGSRFAAAAMILQRALRLPFKRKRLRVKLHSELGWVLFSAGRLDQATRVLRAGLALKPAELQLRGTLLYNLGRIAEKRGNLQHAKRLYRSSVMIRADRTAINRLRSVIRRLRKKPRVPRVTLPRVTLPGVKRK